MKGIIMDKENEINDGATDKVKKEKVKYLKVSKLGLLITVVVIVAIVTSWFLIVAPLIAQNFNKDFFGYYPRTTIFETSSGVDSIDANSTPSDFNAKFVIPSDHTLKNEDGKVEISIKHTDNIDYVSSFEAGDKIWSSIQQAQIVVTNEYACENETIKGFFEESPFKYSDFVQSSYIQATKVVGQPTKYNLDLYNLAEGPCMQTSGWAGGSVGMGTENIELANTTAPDDEGNVIDTFLVPTSKFNVGHNKIFVSAFTLRDTQQGTKKFDTKTETYNLPGTPDWDNAYTTYVDIVIP
jgi:hypothetical protein